MAAHPLRPATDRRHGAPLPHHLANQTRAHLQAINLSRLHAYRVLAVVSNCCPHPEGRFSRVTHPSATKTRRFPFDLHVLGIPPAFILSQDQTLHNNYVRAIKRLGCIFFKTYYSSWSDHKWLDRVIIVLTNLTRLYRLSNYIVV